MTPWGLLLRVRDEPGALERVLGLVRRLGMPLRPEAITRAEDGGWSVVLALTSDQVAVDRLGREFDELHVLTDAITLHAGVRPHPPADPAVEG